MRLTKEHHHKFPRWTSGVRRCDTCNKEEFLTECENWNNCKTCQLRLDYKTGKRVNISTRKLNYCRISYCEACQGIVRIPKGKKPRFCSSKCGASNRKGLPIKGEKWTETKFDDDKERKRAYYKHHYGKTKNWIKLSIRNRIKAVIKKHLLKTRQSRAKLARTEELLGCTVVEFIQYIESQFQPGMTWENYGFDTWHLDHIIPLSYFNVLDEEQLKLACHYKNMQPLWAKDNLSKGSKILYDVDSHLAYIVGEK